MKREFFAAAVILTVALTAGPLNAQVQLFLDEHLVPYDDGNVSAWVFPVAGAMDEAFDDLDDYAKDRSDVRMKKDRGEQMIAEKVSVPAISTHRGDLIGYGYSMGQRDALALIFRMGYDIALNSEEWPDEMENFRTWTRAFMAYHYEQSYARRTDELEKELKSLERDKSQLERKIDRLTDDISKLGRKIAEETETEEINELETEINDSERELKSLMAELPPLESQISSLSTRINQLKAESHTYQSTIGTL